MRVATWNVNSVKQRVPRLLPWLDQRQPDVVCLQETKLTDPRFTELLGDELAGRGYAVALHREGQWNGVAILSRVGLDEVVRGVAGARFPRPEARAVAATCHGIRVHSVYVPNGQVPVRPLPLQAGLAGRAAGAGRRRPGRRHRLRGHEHRANRRGRVRPRRLSARPTSRRRSGRPWPSCGLGLHDVVRDRWPDERVFTYWDYRAGMFHQDMGMRIDLVLASPTVAGRVKAAWVDRQARKGLQAERPRPRGRRPGQAPDGDIGRSCRPAPVARQGTAKARPPT